MRPISDTIARLEAIRQRAGMPLPPEPAGARLADLPAFGDNPGALQAKLHIPARLKPGAALVVVLHGCTQTAEAYDRGAGWSQLADEAGFAVLYPQQTRANNGSLCFNWFQPADTRRGAGEVASIRAMIAAVVEAHGIDSGRIFVTGLSAGGAMAGAMLATYPEVFSGGAIIAGLPYGSAQTVPEAFDRMRGHGGPGAQQLQASLADASGHDGPWPTLSIWHGSADATVAPANADATVAQWRKVHGLGAEPDRTESVAGHRRRVWCDADGREVVESFTIHGMGHGTPLDPAGAGGTSGPFMLDAGISSTHHIARFWGIAGTAAPAGKARTESAPAGAPRGAAQPRGPAAPRGAAALDGEILPPGKPGTRGPQDATGDRPAQPAGTNVGKVIEDALRAAGLMK